jgi:hypothetical protein
MSCALAVLVSQEPAAIQTFRAVPGVVPRGGSVTLQWTTTGTDQVKLEPLGLELPPQGWVRFPLAGRTTFWLHAFNEVGGVSLPVVVNLEGEPSSRPPASTKPLTRREKAQAAARLQAERQAAKVETARLAATRKAEDRAAKRETLRLAAAEKSARLATQRDALRLAAAEEAARLAAQRDALRLAAKPETAAPAAPPRPGAESGPPTVAVVPESVKRAARPDASGHLWIQFVALANPAKIDRLKEQIQRTAGIEVLVTTVADPEVPGRTLQRLRFGPFAKVPAARQRLRELKPRVARLGLKPCLERDTLDSPPGSDR